MEDHDAQEKMGSAPLPELDPRVGVPERPPTGSDATAISPGSGRADRDTSTSDLWHVHEYINSYIRLADSKAAVIVAFLTTLCGALHASRALSQVLSTPPGAWHAVDYLAAFTAVLAVFGLIGAALVLWPRLFSPESVGYIYWHDIVGHKEAHVYSSCWLALDSTDRVEAVLQHIYTLSGICDRKYWWLSWSILFAVCSGVGGAIVLLVTMG